MNIVVLYGGNSNEHEVSLVSAASVVEHLAENHNYTLIPIGIDRKGVWWLQDSAVCRREASKGRLSIVESAAGPISIVPGTGLRSPDGSDLPVDCVFPVLHGKNGEDGTVQGALELAGIAYVGSGVAASAVSMDKVHAKRLWNDTGLPVVPYRVVTDAEIAEDNKLVERLAAELGYPLFVKPNSSGSSVGITRVTAREQLRSAVAGALAHDDVVLLEKAIDARELETAVLGNDTTEAFGPGEVVPTHDFYDYEAKYTDADGAELYERAEVPEGIRREVRRISIAAFEACRCSGLARVDCFLEESSGNVYLNEINTMPGFTPISMYPRMITSGGISYGDLLARLISLATKSGT